MLDQDLIHLLNLPNSQSEHSSTVNSDIEKELLSDISDKEIEDLVNQIETIYRTVDKDIESIIEQRHSA